MSTLRSVTPALVSLVLVAVAACSTKVAVGPIPASAAPPPSSSAAPAPTAPPVASSAAPGMKAPRVIFKTDRIAITEEIEFDGGLATLKPSSESLLDEVAQTIKAHPEVKKLRVEGHCAAPQPGQAQSTNSQLLKLSTDRAQAVVGALGKRGVDAKRLDAQGFGAAQPIAPNDTAEGQAKNRRVDFVITERAKDAPTK